MPRMLIIGDPNDLHTLQKIQFLQAYGHVITVLCEAHEKIRFEKNKLPTECLFGKSLPYFSWKKIGQRRTGLQIICEAIQSNHAELLLILYAEPHIGWAYYHKEIKIPIAVFCYGTDALVTLPQITQKGLLAPMRKYLFKKAFAGVRLIMANSQAQLHCIEHLAPSQTPKKVIRIGIRSAALKSIRSTPRVSPLKRPYVIFPRMMQPIYQHAIAIDALRLLPPAISRNFDFVFLDHQGPNEGYCQLIQNKMDALPDLRFVWLQRLEKTELWHYLKHAALCVQIPSSDGSAVSALEAMFLRCPLLLGPANYDADLFSTIPRTSLTAEEISQKIESLLAQPHMEFPSEALLESATDEALQSGIMENELLRLLQ
jgi:hypothetical protein